MIAPTEHGFVYWVADEQLAAFSRLTPEQRFRWCEETRAFLVAAATPVTIERIRRLRRGDTIDADGSDPVVLLPGVEVPEEPDRRP